MKHPALSRAMSVALLILCLVSFLAGLGGLGKARKDYEASLREQTKLKENLEEYRTLLAENEGQNPYEDQSAALDALQEQHADTSAEHRTELATYSATKGGIQTGVDALDEADAAVAAAKEKFKAEKAAFEAERAAFMKQYEEYQKGQELLLGLKGQAAQMEQLLTITTPEALEQEKLALESRAQELQQEEEALKSEQDPEVLDQKQQELNTKKAALEQEQAAYQERLAAYQEAVTALPALQGQIAGMEAELNKVNGAELETFKAQLDAGAAAMEEGEKQLRKMEESLYYNRTLIWYELGQLEEQAEEMAATRDTLLQESEEISQRKQQSEEQKQREKRLRSLKLGFQEYDSVEAAVEQGQELIPAVEALQAELARQSQQENTCRILACAWMMAALVAGLLCLLGCFEIIKKPRLARRAALLCLLCALVATGALLYCGYDISYAALGLGIFALLQIPVSGVIKKKKA